MTTSAAFTPRASVAVFLAQIANWRELLPVLSAPRILEGLLEIEENRLHRRHRVVSALRAARDEACRLADARNYYHLTARNPLPLAASEFEFSGNRPSRTPYFYRKQAIIWARHHRRGWLCPDGGALNLAKSYLASYRKSLTDWEKKFGIGA